MDPLFFVGAVVGGAVTYFAPKVYSWVDAKLVAMEAKANAALKDLTKKP